MLNDTLKQHLNQIDSSLKSAFETVKFDHKEDGYYSIVEVSDNTVNEDLAPIRVKLTIEHEKLNRDTSHVSWSYPINPDKEGSRVIKRTSIIENIGNDILDIVINKRMDKEYIDSCLVSLIQEDTSPEQEEENKMNADEKENGEQPEASDDEEEFRIGESIIFTDYEYNEHKGVLQKKISLSIMDKEYKGWIVKAENGEETKVMDYDIHRDSRLPKWWNN